jgi:hypothetical protein
LIGPDFFTEDVAADSVDEFLQFSVSTDEDPDPEPKPALEGDIWFRAPKHGWCVTDGKLPGTVTTSSARPADAPHEVVVQCSPSSLLLWLYARIRDEELLGGSVDAGLLQRFRALCFTD